MTTSAEHLAGGGIAGAIAAWDDDKHAVKEYLALPVCRRCDTNRATTVFADLDVCEPCFGVFQDWGRK
jgi:hypothetical protein